MRLDSERLEIIFWGLRKHYPYLTRTDFICISPGGLKSFYTSSKQFSETKILVSWLIHNI